jgi:hypothetical protein
VQPVLLDTCAIVASAIAGTDLQLRAPETILGG